jgi:hypothetical protein
VTSVHPEARAPSGRRPLALALVTAIVLLAGCSGAGQPTESPSPDPSTDRFAGTWRLDSADATFVIINEGGQYRALAASPGLDGVVDLALVRQQSDSLRFRVETGETIGDTYRFILTQDATELKVVAVEEGMTEPARVVVDRVSDSTASPTPFSLQ